MVKIRNSTDVQLSQKELDCSYQIKHEVHMLFLKSGSDLYWDGRKFQPDYRKAIVFGAMMGAEKDIKRASKIDANCKLEALNEEQWAELEAISFRRHQSPR
jgi:hypothetical protein